MARFSPWLATLGSRRRAGGAKMTSMTSATEPVTDQSLPLWRRITALFEGAPESEMERLPCDGAEQHDHYIIYGTSRRGRRRSRQQGARES